MKSYKTYGEAIINQFNDKNVDCRFNPLDEARRLLKLVDDEFDGNYNDNKKIIKRLSIKICRELAENLPCCTEFGIDETKEEDLHTSCYQFWLLVIKEIEKF